MVRALSLLALLAVATAAPAQEAYTLKFKVGPEAGKSILYKKVTKDSGFLKFTNTETKKESDMRPEGAEVAYERSVVARDAAGKPTAYAVRYDKESKREDGKTTAKSYEGKTLYWETPKGGKERIGVVGDNPVSAKDAEDLYEEREGPSSFEALLEMLDPGKPVRVGDTWPLDAAKYAKANGVVPDGQAATATAKLAKVETAGGTRFGTFEIAFAFAVKGIGRKGPTEFATPLATTATGTLRIAIDGSTTEYEQRMTLTLKGETDVLPAAAKVRAAVDLKGEETTTRSAERPAPVTALPAKLTWVPRPGEWATVAPADAGFKVLMPGKPAEKLSESRERFNDMWTLEADGRQVTYVLGRTAVTAANVGAKEVADTIAKKNAGAKVEEIAFAGEKAYLLTYSAGGIDFHHRVIVKDKVLWQVVVGGTAGKSKPEDRAKFFDSFEFVEPKAK